VETVGFESGASVIELLRPLSEDSAVARFRGDAATKMHHVAYQVPNLEAEIARLKGAGVRLIDEKPRRGAHGNRIAFLHPKSTAGVLVELCQRTG
jgi:methylmalonyl-CoA epimerase